MELSVIKNKVYYSGKTAEIQIIEKNLSDLSPDRFFSPSFKNKRWNGWVYFFNQGAKCFDFCFLDYVLNVLRDYDIKFSLKYDIQPLVLLESDFVFSDFFLGEKRSYQRQAVILFLSSKVGTLKIPTRGGKTFVLGEVIRILIQKNSDMKFFCVVDSLLLLNQMKKDLEIVNPKENIGIIQGEKFQIERITICMTQTLNSILSKRKTKKSDRREKFLKLISECDFYCIDEAHEYLNRDFFKKPLFKKMQYKMYLTATPWDESENLIPKLEYLKNFGPMVCEIKEKSLIEKEVLTRSKVIFLALEKFKLKDESEEFLLGLNKDLTKFEEAFRRKIILNHLRNNAIKIICEILQKRKIKTLVMFQRSLHGSWITSRYLNQNYEFEDDDKKFIDGKDKIKEREKRIKSFLNDPNDNLLATSDILKKAITLPEAKVLFDVSFSKSSKLFIQRRGRVLGRIEGKEESLIICFADVFAPFKEASLLRISTFEKTESIIEVIDVLSDSFQENFEKIINEWF